MNTAEPHFNAEAGRASEFEEIRLTHPVFAGDALWSESLVLSTRPSKRHPKAGVVSLKTRTLNQFGDQVLSLRYTFLVYRRGYDRPATFPEAKSPLHG